MAQTPLVGQGLLISRIHDLTQFYTPVLVGLLWMRDQPDAVTSTRQHTTLTTDRRPCPRGF